MNARGVNALAGVIHAAMKTKSTAAGIAMAVDSAGMLMSPETAAELARLRAGAVPLAEDRFAEIRSVDLLALVGERAAGQISGYLADLLAEVDRLRTERHSTNEALSEAAESIRAKDARIAELEQQLATAHAELRIGAPWTCHVCSKKNIRDVCVICETYRPDEAGEGA